MSYFMTISGVLPQRSFPSLEFLPVSQGQKYIADLEQELSVADGTPLWFVHDGETGTSHRFIVEAQNYYNQHGILDGTVLLELMEECAKVGSAFRIWVASDKADCHRHVANFCSIGELRSGILRLLSEGWDIRVRLKGASRVGNDVLP